MCTCMYVYISRSPVNRNVQLKTPELKWVQFLGGRGVGVIKKNSKACFCKETCLAFFVCVLLFLKQIRIQLQRGAMLCLSVHVAMLV